MPASGPEKLATNAIISEPRFHNLMQGLISARRDSALFSAAIDSVVPSGTGGKLRMQISTR
jgi:hypothetical protein